MWWGRQARRVLVGREVTAATLIFVLTAVRVPRHLPLKVFWPNKELGAERVTLLQRVVWAGLRLLVFQLLVRSRAETALPALLTVGAAAGALLVRMARVRQEVLLAGLIKTVEAAGRLITVQRVRRVRVLERAARAVMVAVERAAARAVQVQMVLLERRLRAAAAAAAAITTLGIHSAARVLRIL